MFNWLIKFTENKKANWFTAVFVFLIFSGYYFILLYSRVATDIQDHARVAYSFVVNHDKLSPNFLYFFLLAVLSGFSKYYPVYYVSSIILLSFAITAKFLLNSIYIEKYTRLSDNKTLSLILSFVLLFIIALPGAGYFSDNNFYFGQLTATVWHNSTIIFLMPFAMLLFFRSYELLFFKNSDHKNKIITQIVLLIILNALIKPSFLFTLLPSVFVFFIHNNLFLKTAHNKMQQLLPYVFGLLFIAAEYFVIYKLNYASNISIAVTDGSVPQILLSPFEVWKGFSDNIPVAIITSLFFPIVFIVTTKGEVLKNKMVQFALVNFIFGLLIWILLSEKGRVYHANFYWQIVVTVYLLFFSMVLDLVNRIKLKQLGALQQWLISGAFLLHFIWGVFYWVKIIIFRGYN